MNTKAQKNLKIRKHKKKQKILKHKNKNYRQLFLNMSAMIVSGKLPEMIVATL